MFDKLLAGVVIWATKLCNNVAPQVARKCCPYYLAFNLKINQVVQNGVQCTVYHKVTTNVLHKFEMQS